MSRTQRRLTRVKSLFISPAIIENAEKLSSVQVSGRSNHPILADFNDSSVDSDQFLTPTEVDNKGFDESEDSIPLVLQITNKVVRANLMNESKMIGGNIYMKILDEIENQKISIGNYEKSFQSMTVTEKNTTLLWCSFLKRYELLECLVKYGADVKYCDANGYSPLHMSAFSGCLKCTSFLLSKGADPNFFTKASSPLRCSIFGKSLATAKVLINNGANVKETKLMNKVDGNLLQSAVRCNAPSFIELFIEQGAHVNELSSCGTNAIHLAADLGYAKCLEVLLKAPKANPNKKVTKRWTDRTALHYAAEEGSSECVQLLLDSKADVNAKDFRGRTPLHMAAKASCVDCVRILLKEGNADVDAADNDSRTPLHVAVRKSESNLMVIKILLSFGATINKQDTYGCTPLYLAALGGLADCVELLIKSGANVTTKSKKGITALNVISRKTPSSLCVITKMLDKGISLSQSAGNETDVTLNFKEIVKHSLPHETTYLKAFVDENKKQILDHPLCKAFLHLKWNKVKMLYSLKLLFNFVKILLFTLFVLSTFAKDCNHDHNKKEGEVNNSTLKNGTIKLIPENGNRNSTTDMFLEEGSKFWRCKEYGGEEDEAEKIIDFSDPPNQKEEKWICKNGSHTGEILKSYIGFMNYRIQITIISMIVMAEIILNVFAFNISRHYFIEMEKIFQLLEIFLFSVTFLLEFWHEEEKACEEFLWQFHFGAFAIIVCWFNYLFLLGQLPSFGSSVDMFNRILKEFLKLFAIFLCVFIGFAVAFLIIYPTSAFFANPFIGFISILIFMVGELQPDMITKKEGVSLTLEITSQLMFLLFMFLVTIVLMNLLIGIAVNDIHQLKKTAVRSKHVRQIKLIYQLETVMLRDWMPNWLKNYILYSPNRYAYTLRVRPLNISETRLPKDILKSAYEIAKASQSIEENDINDDEFDGDDKEEEDPVNLQDVMREIQELKNLIAQLQNK